MKRVIVTGGAGFIGSNFLNDAVRRFPDARFINVDSLGYAGNLASLSDVDDPAAGPRAGVDRLPNYAFERVDIRDGEAVDHLVQEHAPDLVVHFAAESHVDRSIVGPRAFVQTNVEGTFNLLDACRRHWPKGTGLFHHVSTDEVYGSLGPQGLFTEETRYDPSSPYSASKAASDHLVRAYTRTYGLPAKITNCSNNYGPYQFPEKLIPLMVLNALERRPLPVYGQGQNIRDWLFVEDHCQAIWAVIHRGKVGETYNVGGNCEVRNIDVVQSICRIVAEETGAPEAELRALVTHVADRPGHDLRYAIDASKIKRECGWEPRETFETGLRRTIRWYLANPKWVELVRSGDYRNWIDTNYANRNGQ